MELSGGRIRAGRWEGLLTGAGETPEVEVTHLGEALPGVELRAVPEGWAITVPVPAEALSDGVQTFLIRDARRGAVLGRFVIAAGAPLEEDLRAEIALLRAELELLKAAFRRRCPE